MTLHCVHEIPDVGEIFYCKKLKVLCHNRDQLDRCESFVDDLAGMGEADRAEMQRHRTSWKWQPGDRI